MLGFLHRKLLNWSTDKQKQEMSSFLFILRDMPDDEVAFLVLAATNARLVLRVKGDLLDPLHLFRQNTDLAIELQQIVTGLQQKGDRATAAAVMVWLFSVRAAINPPLNDLGRQLWQELARGFPHAHDLYYLTKGITHNFDVQCLDQYDRIPFGLEPSGQMSLF